MRLRALPGTLLLLVAAAGTKQCGSYAMLYAGGERHESVPLQPAIQVLHPLGAGFGVACWQTQSGLFGHGKKSARFVQDRPGPGGQEPDCERLSNAAGNEQWGRCYEGAGVTAGWTGICAQASDKCATGRNASAAIRS